jgi:hypothetical protein
MSVTVKNQNKTEFYVNHEGVSLFIERLGFFFFPDNCFSFGYVDGRKCVWNHFVPDNGSGQKDFGQTESSLSSGFDPESIIDFEDLPKCGFSFEEAALVYGINFQHESAFTNPKLSDSNSELERWIGKSIGETTLFRLNLAILSKRLKMPPSVATKIIECQMIEEGFQIVLPRHHFENLSRGRGSCRSLDSNGNIVWGKRVDEGYLVGKGKWIVNGNDGFSRKKDVSWRVETVKIGNQNYTMAF